MFRTGENYHRVVKFEQLSLSFALYRHGYLRPKNPTHHHTLPEEKGPFQTRELKIDHHAYFLIVLLHLNLLFLEYSKIG